MLHAYHSEPRSSCPGVACDTLTSGHLYRWDTIADVVESEFRVWVYFIYPLFLDIVLSVAILLGLLRMMAIHSRTYISCAMILKNMSSQVDRPEGK